MTMDGATRRRLVFDTAAWYQQLMDVLANSTGEGSGEPVAEGVPWASARQRLQNRAARAVQSGDVELFFSVLGEFDRFWDEVQRIQSSFALALLETVDSTVDMESYLHIVSENANDMVQAWAKSFPE